MTYIDLNCRASAENQAVLMGWKPLTPRWVFLEKANQSQLVRRGDVVSSENGMWLRIVARKGVLLNPTSVRHFEKDQGLVRAVAESKSAFELGLRPILHAYGKRRSRLMQAYRTFFALCQKRKAPVFVTSQAESVFDVKSPKEMVACIVQLGVAPDRARALIGKEAEKWIHTLRS